MRKIAKQTTNPSTVNSEIDADTLLDSLSGSEMMQTVLSKPRSVKKAGDLDIGRINGVVIGELSEPTENGQTTVHYPESPSGKPVVALSTESMANKKPGCPVALSFVDGDPARPIILGLIHKTGVKKSEVKDTGFNEQVLKDENPGDQEVNVRLDGETLTLSADREIVLKCGKSSITLTRAGKIILKGAYLSNHSTGVNRIKGGSVQIN
jgi:hypothetical protein